ncbi:Protein-glutamine gamma-glutamyltransferase [Aquisphaera giovannonii]|uniref:Protein-glutamine gamma-glutamyltransferase n=1 Tax=Aquisphaera giovannonii TaxID=406548 RepID=A0A5B9VWQ5_9BACT|nr:transglutaminase family protein [Aquisphaera giovannonii]QEH32140.1 Protein-glutamine gamma-glutamyltransferase [Aquisphaera giovannonii]
MIYRAIHTTIYEYVEPVSLCHNVVHLTARGGPWQAKLSGELRISPAPSVMTERIDYFGNTATFATIGEPHRELSVTAINVVDVTPEDHPDPDRTPPWEAVRDLLRAPASADALAASQFAFDSPYVPTGPGLAEYAARSFPPGRPIFEAALDLTRRIHAEFRYDPTATTIATPIREVLERRHGVCQDFAHLQIGCLRSLGLAARYVSGYLVTRPVAPAGRPDVVGAEASHAWLSFFCPGFGWIDIDPTNNQVPHDRHIVLAWGRDYDDVSPIKGVILGGGNHTVKVTVDIVALPDGDADLPVTIADD